MFTLPRLMQTPFENYRHTPQVSSPLSSSPLRHSSSPLSPRDANIQYRRFAMSSPTRSSKSDKESFSKRPVKKNPMIHKVGNARETRRKLFLKKVREDSEDKRWEARGGDDEMMRTIWVAEQRRRAERKAREAEYAPSSQEEEGIEFDHFERRSDNLDVNDESMVDEVIQQENDEMEALILSMESESSNRLETREDGPETPYGSDDDDYDSIFMEVMNGESTSGSQQHFKQEDKEDHDMMDIS